jgi:hypothetical protein
MNWILKHEQVIKHDPEEIILIIEKWRQGKEYREREEKE